MSADPKPVQSKSSISEIVNAAAETHARPTGAYKWVRFVLIAVTVLGATPTVLQLYQSYMHGIPYNQVNHRLAQYDLWVKNGGCNVVYRELNSSKGVRINVGACDQTGDVSIKLTKASGEAKFEWIAFNDIAARAAMLSLFSSAYADTPPSSGKAGQIVVAQAETKVMCQAINGPRMVRMVSEGPKCFRETIVLVKGQLEKREEVQCPTACVNGQPAR